MKFILLTCLGFFLSLNSPEINAAAKLKNPFKQRFNCVKECENELLSTITKSIATPKKNQAFVTCSNPDLYEKCTKKCRDSEIPKCKKAAIYGCNYDSSKRVLLTQQDWTNRYGDLLGEAKQRKAKCITNFTANLNRVIPKNNTNFSMQTRRMKTTPNPEWQKLMNTFTHWLDRLVNISHADVYACNKDVIISQLFIFDKCHEKMVELIGDKLNFGDKTPNTLKCATDCSTETCKDRETHRRCALNCASNSISSCLQTGRAKCYMADPKIRLSNRLIYDDNFTAFDDPYEKIRIAIEDILTKPVLSKMDKLVRGFSYEKVMKKQSALARHMDLVYQSTVVCSQSHPKTRALLTEARFASNDILTDLLTAYQTAKPKLGTPHSFSQQDLNDISLKLQSLF